MLVSKRRSLVSKKGKNTSQTGKQFRKYFYCFCLAEALLAEAEVEKTPTETGPLSLHISAHEEKNTNLRSTTHLAMFLNCKMPSDNNK